MPQNPSQNQGEQWLISVRAQDQHESGQAFQMAMQMLKSQPDVEIIRTIGTNVAVIRAASSTIAALQVALAPHIVIAPDKPMQLF